MGEVSGRGLFDDYRSIGFGVAIMSSVSVVIPAKNEARNARLATAAAQLETTRG